MCLFKSAGRPYTAAAYRTIELWMLSMERELGQEIVDVLGNERRISSHALAGRGAPRQALEPASVRLRLFENDRMALLEDLVDGNERFERLHLVGEDWLPGLWLGSYRGRGSDWSRRTLSCPARKRPSSCGPTCTQCMLAHAFLRQYQHRSCLAEVVNVRFGEISSIFVALRMLTASSDSCLGVYLVRVRGKGLRG
jgi:hypothetical protein